MFTVRLDKLAGHILRNLYGLSDSPPLGDQSRQFLAGSQEPSLRQGLYVNCQKYFLHILAPTIRIVSLPKIDITFDLCCRLHPLLPS